MPLLFFLGFEFISALAFRLGNYPDDECEDAENQKHSEPNTGLENVADNFAAAQTYYRKDRE